MTKNVDAIYENGAFRPVGDVKIPLPDGTRIRLSVEPVEQATTEDNVLELAAMVYVGLSKNEIADIEQIATDRSRFFST
jgi:predicted DNA-binding antitoxin AbrB/MazE fold protein